MTKRQALKIIRMLCRAYEAGDSDDTLAFRLQEALKELKP